MDTNSNFSNLDKKDRIDFYIALAVVVLAMGFILSYSFSENAAFLADSEIHENVVNQEIKNQVILVDSIITINEQTYVAEKENSDALVAQHESKKHHRRLDHQNRRDHRSEVFSDSTQQQRVVPKRKKPKMDKKKRAEKILQNMNATKEEAKTVVEAIPPVDATKTIKETAIVNKEVDEIPTPKKVEEVKPITNTNQGGCVIIIGAFTQEKNINKLTSKLRRDGYNYFTTPYRNTTRVGVYEECREDILGKTLSEIRKKYAKDAVIYKRED